MIDNDNDDVVITIIALVIGLTLVAICLVCFHIKKVREGNNNSSNPREDSAEELNRRRELYRRLQRRTERELSMQQVPVSQVDPPSYHVAIDIIDPRPPPPTYDQHRRDTRIASSTQQQQQ